MRCGYCPLTDEETEGERDQLTCPKPSGQALWEPAFEDKQEREGAHPLPASAQPWSACLPGWLHCREPTREGGDRKERLMWGKTRKKDS